MWNETKVKALADSLVSLSHPHWWEWVSYVRRQYCKPVMVGIPGTVSRKVMSAK